MKWARMETMLGDPGLQGFFLGALASSFRVARVRLVRDMIQEATSSQHLSPGSRVVLFATLTVRSVIRVGPLWVQTV